MTPLSRRSSWLIISSVLFAVLFLIPASAHEWNNHPDESIGGELFYMENTRVDYPPSLKKIPDDNKTTLYNRAKIDAGDTIVMPYPVVHMKTLYHAYVPDLRPEMKLYLNPQGQYGVHLKVTVRINYTGNVRTGYDTIIDLGEKVDLSPAPDQIVPFYGDRDLGLEDIEYGSFQVRIERLDNGNKSVLIHCNYGNAYSWIRMPYEQKEFVPNSTSGSLDTPRIIAAAVLTTALLGLIGFIYYNYQKNNKKDTEDEPEEIPEETKADKTRDKRERKQQRKDERKRREMRRGGRKLR